MVKTLIRNIVSNWLGFAVRAGVVFFLTPFVIHSLGDTRYGIWALIMAITSQFGLLDLGFRKGVTVYLTRHLAATDFVQLNSMASSAFSFLVCCGAIVGLASVGVAWVLPYAFTVPLESVVESRWCIGIIGIGSAIQFPTFVFSSVLWAKQRYDLDNFINVPIQLASAAATVLVLDLEYGLIGLCAVTVSSDLVGTLIRWRTAYSILPQLNISLGLREWSNVRAMAGFGLWTFIISRFVQLKSSGAILIIGAFMPISALTPYNLALGLITYYSQLFNMTAGVFFPAATQLEARGDTQALRKMYLLGSRMVILLAMTAAVIGAVWAEDFFRLWVGSRFLSGEPYPSVALLFWLLISAAFVATAQTTGIQILLGSRKPRPLVIIAVAEALASLGVCIALVTPFGLVGIALGLLVPTIVFQGLITPYVICRSLGIPVKVYASTVWMRPCVVGALSAGTLILLRHVLPSSSSWADLFVSGALAGVGVAVLIIVVGLDASERNRFVFQPLNTVWLQFASK